MVNLIAVTTRLLTSSLQSINFMMLQSAFH